MYGINLIKVAQVLGKIAVTNILFGQNGFIYSIYQEILKNCAEKNIEMVKFMMHTMARQDEKVYDEIVEILKKNFSEDELKEILD